MNVRFKKEYSPDWDINISYELISDEIVYDVNGQNETIEEYYNTKLLGLVPVRKMEITNDQNDVPAIDIWIKLSQL